MTRSLLLSWLIALSSVGCTAPQCLVTGIVVDQQSDQRSPGAEVALVAVSESKESFVKAVSNPQGVFVLRYPFSGAPELWVRLEKVANVPTAVAPPVKVVWDEQDEGWWLGHCETEVRVKQ